ncbi:hypothetical protein NLX86_18700 [Streptomyces sp. A3M-1-3]|uniref:hypothetical protein n=1 Tax=Streptomyces sp. A3M-1-3 TaxID=2962044 RepID=UPI0020B72572|nr:hypothetical protein [Streptomyces sp. A3M-1-3]MCP3820047.1 hypothetical protein [Streptomyces sp. A3M-1-3]
MARPKTGETPIRNVRVPDGVWNAVKAKAATEGRTITDVVVTALHRYAATPAKREAAEQEQPEAP